MSDPAVLVTGAAGFIGFHVAQSLLSAGRKVVGLDIINDYYDPRLKQARLDNLKRDSNFSFAKVDLADRASTKLLFEQHRFAVVIHLAAQAGVRYSLDHPHAYVDANLEGFINVLEGCRAIAVASTFCSHLPPRCMAPTPNCRFRCRIMSITRSACMPRRKRPTN